MKNIWVHIEIIDFWLQIWYLSTFWNIVEISSETPEEKCVTLLGYFSQYKHEARYGNSLDLFLLLGETIEIFYPFKKMQKY